jgi:hypothetical protein
MGGVLTRRFFGVLLSLALGWLPMAPAEHVHETEEHGQLHLVVHRHLAHHSVHHADDRDRVLDDDDAPILTFTAVFLVPRDASPIPVPAITGIVIAAPASPARQRTPERLAPFPHGPPRATASLRAPPLFA